MNILFITNSSLLDPIIYSQGLPQIIHNTEVNKYSFSILSFEKRKTTELEEYRSISEKLKKLSIKTYSVILPKRTFHLGRTWYWFLGIMYAARIIIRDEIKIIHVRSYPPAFIATIIKLLFNIKFIFDTRGIYVEEQAEAHYIERDSFHYKLEKFLERLYLRWSDIIIAVSNKQLQFYSEICGEKIIEKKGKVIPNSVDLKKFKPSTFANKSKVKLDFAYVGDASVRYDLKRIFDLFKFAYNMDSNTTITILTYADEKIFTPYLNSLQDEMKKNVNLLRVASNEVPEHLTKCNVGLALYTPLKSNKVCAPIKLGEYLASGIPVVISNDVGDSTELIEKYDVGIILNNENYEEIILELLKLIKDKNINSRCIDVAEKDLNLTVSAEKYKEFYKKLI